MSSQQTSLTGDEAPTGVRVKEQHERALDVDESPYAASNTDAPVRQPNTGINTTCQFCENVVTAQFVRIFGSDDGRIHCCLDCATFRELQDGAAARPGYTPDDAEPLTEASE